MAFTPDMLTRIEAQRAYFADDERVKERAQRWRDATPEECLAAVVEQCREAEYFLSLKSADEIERLIAARSIPEDTIAILEGLQRRPR